MLKRLTLVLVLALGVSGCATAQNLFNLATTPVAITPQMVYDAENGFKAVTSGLVGYRRLCIRKVIDPVTRNCRKVIAAIQPYTRAAATILPDLRASVAANDQKTAIDAYKALHSLIQNIQAERQKAGV